jgi:hypothetical protein
VKGILAALGLWFALPQAVWAQTRATVDTVGASPRLNIKTPTVIYFHRSHQDGRDTLSIRLCRSIEERQHQQLSATRDTLTSLRVSVYSVVTDTLSIRHVGGDTSFTPYNNNCGGILLVAPKQPILIMEDYPLDLYKFVMVDYFDPQLRYSRAHRLEGCYGLGYGSWQDADSKLESWMNLGPGLVRLDTTTIRTFPRRLLRARVPDDSLAGSIWSQFGRGAEIPIGWIPIGDDSLSIGVGDGFHGFNMQLKASGERITGVLHTYTDLNDNRPRPRRAVAGHRIACSAMPASSER